MRVFTDGSLKGNSGGWAAVSDTGKTWQGRIKTNDSYFPELEAVLQVTRQAEGPFSLVTDHIGIANEIRSMIGFTDWKPPLKGRGMWRQLHRLKDKIEGVEWMPRCSNQYMVMADGLAREAARG